MVSSTAVGAFVTGLNALIYAIGAFEPAAIPFLALWLGVILMLCLTMTRMSRKARGRSIGSVSRRAARRLVQTSILLALPWAILPLYVIGFHGPGQPMVVILVCTGMLSGGTFMLHRALVAALSYMATIFLAIIVSSHIGGWDMAWSVTGYGIVYASFLAYFAFIAGETARQRDESVAALSRAVAKLRQARDENYLLANIDDTTGLLNRKAFNDRLRKTVAHHRRTGRPFSVLLMDLDRFKHVNDLFGHSTGDELLAEIARRLRKGLSERDVIARLGGDEFSVILMDAADEEAVRTVTDRLLKSLARPAHLAGRHIHSGASIGAVTCPMDASEPSDLLLKADLALNRAKEIGRGQCVRFDDALRRQVKTNDEIEAALRTALNEGLLYVEYQPKIALSDGRLIGAEALVRLKSATGANIAPERFLAIASERGLIPRLTRYIAEIVARNILTWRRGAFDPGKIALNLHPDDFKSQSMLVETIEMFESHGITGRDLILEVTEDCFIDRGTDAANKIFDALADRGYELSLDDFGTGHASLAHLKQIRVAEIKIDRSFITGVEARRDDRAIVAAIAEIARGMGIRAVAEGVETEAQRQILTQMGVHSGQGYLWSQSIDAAGFAGFPHRGPAVPGDAPAVKACG
ncbi:diguanylate cyclase (GGDEF)-like protein [Cereibacter ovatus]|uniref:Diguanylate cyclase (GGDEF)-like protein n=1 Tax=Cereibacter ovatus TaxID=439529 RepID=A0A285CSY1_9RHOB|nr:EAL domain-containing protein [Cereibacter ovatus]SNX70158.1 diguanylate cyclase (GGDEF)-like protein [Cereibacter ovatus]